MKKLPLLLATLTLGAGQIPLLTSNTHALYIDNKNNTWYTVAELLAYQKEVSREENELCSTDQSCHDEWFFNRLENDPKFQALSILEQQQFAVTAVNPGQETFKVLAFSENMMLKRWGISERVSLNKFYLAWFETEAAGEMVGNFSAYEEELYNDILPETHTLYAHRPDLNRAEFPGVTDVEVEFAVRPGSNMGMDQRGLLGYLVDGEGYNAVGGVYYRPCVEADDYIEGMECRMMISAEGGVTFMPPRETLMSQTNENEGDDEGSNDSDDNGNNGGENNGNNEEINILGLESSGDDNNEPENEDQIEQANVAIKLPTTPNTGTHTNQEKEQNIEFPWWLGAILGINVLTLIWFFLPIGLEKTKKSPKKS